MPLMNPMGINGPNWTPNHIQPDGNPSQPVGGTNVAGGVVGGNPMGLSGPVPQYVQPADNVPNRIPRPTITNIVSQSAG